MQLFSYLAAGEACFSAQALFLAGLQGRDLDPGGSEHLAFPSGRLSPLEGVSLK